MPLHTEDRARHGDMPGFSVENGLIGPTGGCDEQA